MDPLAEVDLSPPRYAVTRVVCTYFDKKASSSDEDEDEEKKLVKEMKVDLNKSVRDFKAELRLALNVDKSFF